MESLIDDLNYFSFILIFTAVGVYWWLIDKEINRIFSAFIALMFFVCIVTALYFSYIKTGFPAWMRWPGEFLVKFNMTSKELFIKPGIYSLDTTGWQHNMLNEDDIFTCKVCGDIVQVTIHYGSEESRYASNSDFIESFNTEKRQRDFAELMIKSQGYDQQNIKIDINKVGISEIGGLKVLEYYVIVESPSSMLHNNSMIGVYKKRMVIISLFYPDGAMNGVSKYYINRMYGSLRFF